MSTPESKPTHLPWALGNARIDLARVDLISQSGNMDLAYELGRVYTDAEEMSKNYQATNSGSPEVELRFCP
jgi:hypothetical protein